MALALIALGANLGDRRAALDRAVAMLNALPAVALRGQSRWHETRPAGGPSDQPAYLNGALLIQTPLEPSALLAALRQVEDALGRRRDVLWGPRTLDLDLLLYDRLVLDTPALVVPHPRMAWRRFVLEPAAEIAPAMLHPPTGWTVDQLLEHLNRSANYVALTGPIGAGKTHLAQALAEATAARLIQEPLDAQRLAAFYRNPAGNAWPIEVEFLDRRTQLLTAEGVASADHRLSISDFWFDQSWAFVSVWLGPEEQDEFLRRWREARQHVIQPRLVVVVDAAPAILYERIRRRARPGEEQLRLEKLEKIHAAVLRQALQPGHGPVLQVDGAAMDRALAEVQAAVIAMQ